MALSLSLTAMPWYFPIKIMGTLYSDQVKIEFQHLDVYYNNGCVCLCMCVCFRKTKIEIIAGNEDNLMFSQANGTETTRHLHSF